MGDLIEFQTASGPTSGYLAAPASGGPGVVVIQEWWGLVPHIVDVCDRFAAAGLTALAPDLYHGATTTEPDEAGKLMMALDMDRAAGDLSGAIDELCTRTGAAKVAVVGFCMGGGLAMLAATRRGDAVRACVPFYGVIPWEGPKAEWSALGGPILGHYAENDGWAGPDVAGALEADVRAAGGAADVHVYGGCDHAFFNDTRPEVYDAPASALAWERTLAFLRSE